MKWITFEALCTISIGTGLLFIALAITVHNDNRPIVYFSQSKQTCEKVTLKEFTIPCECIDLNKDKYHLIYVK